MSDEMKQEPGALRGEMHKGMAGLRQDFDGLRGEMHKGVGELRHEMAALREDMRRDMADIRAMFRRTMIYVANMSGDITEIRHELAENVATKADISGVYDHLDDFAGFRRDSDFNKSKDVHRLDDFDDRLKKLEGRR